tara:strand:+ start:13575 stop:15248 length:1674 start_codon:yes stop_codon:yes gene_type:complete
MSILLSALIDSGGGVGGVSDGREFKRWQDFYGEHSGPASYHTEITQSQRTINGVAVNRMVQNTTWTVPSGVSKIRITAIGAGGGGGRYNGTYHGSGGGAGGAFSSGEYNVTAGQVLDVQVGKSGYGIHRSQGSGTGAGGQQTIVEMSSGDGGSSTLYVQAPGGPGGPPNSGGASNSGAGTVSGSALSGGSITNNGGSGGNANSNAIGWGPEGYGGGGGGSAGSFKGNGFRGGHGSPGYGYSFTGASGGGIGGEGIRAFGSQTASTYHAWSGGGGGSAGAGYTGQDNDSNPAFTSSQPYGKGGEGTSGSASINGYTYDCVNTDDTSYGKQFGDQYANWESNFKRMNGARYGDGEVTATSGGGGAGNPSPSGVTYNQYEAQLGIGSGGGGAGTGFEAGSGATISGVSVYPAKMFNGILGRCQGGGGAGTGCKSSGPNGSNDQSYPAGQGGAGAGGAGAACVTSNGNGSWTTKDDVHKWNPSDMAFGWTNTFYTTEAAIRNGGAGGAGGALGGGGSCTNYGCSGPGGIGAGGGGASGHYSGSSYNGSGGDGGPGYVLIEW